MTEKEIRLAVQEVVEEIKRFPDGQRKYYPEYKFSIERKKIYYLTDKNGVHTSGSATGLIPYIKKAVTERGAKK